jgi:PPIC-type PPIASE domain
MWPIKALFVIALSLLQNPASAQQGLSPAVPGAAGVGRSSSAPDAAVGPAQPVITIHGVCDQEARPDGGQTAGCSRVITRKEFEKLMDALNPGGQEISSSGRQNLAQAYVEALAFADAARKAGADESEQFREVLYWARLRAIADLYRRNLQEKFRSPSAAEVDAYYREHLPSYERVRLLRILVPRETLFGADKAEFDKKALAAAQAAHARAVKGDDPEQIQKDAYAALGLDRPPATDLGTYRRADFIEKEAADVFALRPGEISPLEIEVKSYVIYKVVSKETLTEALAKPEIVREISQQKYRDAVKAILDSATADFNEQYFGPIAPKPPMEAPAIPRRSSH